MRYRKKPVEVEAIQWTPDNRAEVVAFAEDRTPHGPGDRVVHPEHGPSQVMSVWVVKADRFLPIIVGTWLIAEPDGVGVYPCVADAFADTYEPA